MKVSIHVFIRMSPTEYEPATVSPARRCPTLNVFCPEPAGAPWLSVKFESLVWMMPNLLKCVKINVIPDHLQSAQPQWYPKCLWLTSLFVRAGEYPRGRPA